jgi:hypothetical protein
LSGASQGGTGITLIGSNAFGQVGTHNLAIESNFVLGLRAALAYGSSFSNITVRNNQFRASNSTIVDLLDYQSGDFAFAGNAYRSEANANRWFSINQNTFFGLPAWTTFIGEAGATTAPFVNPASAPDIESYHASIGGALTFTAFLNEARQQSRQSWRDEYTAGRVIAYLRQQLGQSPIPLSPSLAVRLNATTFRAGDPMIVDAIFAAGSPPAIVDAYIVVRLPDGSFLSLLPGGQVSPGLVPFMRNFTSFDKTPEVFRYTLNGSEPPGTYAWLSALVTPGTLNIVGPLTQVTFTIAR